MEITKEYTCQHCHRRKARWLCLIHQKSGQHHAKMLCAFCSFITVPQQSTTTKFELLYDLLPSTGNEASECESGLVPTGEATLLKTIEEVPVPIGFFFEMRCPKCGFLIDVALNDVSQAKVSYLHPNRNYHAANKKSAKVGEAEKEAAD